MIVYHILEYLWLLIQSHPLNTLSVCYILLNSEVKISRLGEHHLQTIARVLTQPWSHIQHENQERSPPHAIVMIVIKHTNVLNIERTLVPGGIYILYLHQPSHLHVSRGYTSIPLVSSSLSIISLFEQRKLRQRETLVMPEQEIPPPEIFPPKFPLISPTTSQCGNIYRVHRNVDTNGLGWPYAKLSYAKPNYLGQGITVCDDALIEGMLYIRILAHN